MLRRSRFVRLGTSPKRWLVILGLSGALVSVGAEAFAQDSSGTPAATAESALSDVEVERRAEALSRSVMSPFCPGRTISACPSPNAQAWREDIRRWVREGVSAEEIRQRLAARAPEHNLSGAPLERLGWALPVGIGLLSIVALWLALRYLLRAQPAAAATKKADESTPPPVADDREDWDAKLKQELDAFEQ